MQAVFIGDNNTYSETLFSQKLVNDIDDLPLCVADVIPSPIHLLSS